MKKFLLGIFLMLSFYALGELAPIRYEIDERIVNVYTKEKAEFKKKYEELIRKNDQKGLIKLLNEYIKKYPDDEYAYEALGTAHLSFENLEHDKKAEQYYRKAIELGNDDTAVYSMLLVLHKYKKELPKEYLDKLEGTKIEVLKAIRSYKTDAMLGRIYSIIDLTMSNYNQKKYRIAERYALEVLRYDKENEPIIQILNNIYIEQKKYKKVEDLNIPLAEKGNIMAQCELAILYFKNYKNYAEAEKWAKKILETSQKEKSYTELAVAKKILSDIEKIKTKSK